jgi:transposase
VGPPGQGQRWTAARKPEVVLRLFRGEPLDLPSRELRVELYRLEKWRDAAPAGMREALKAGNGDPRFGIVREKVPVALGGR